MLVYLFVPVVLAGVFFFLNLVNKGSSQQAIVEANTTVTKQQRPKKQTKSTRKPAATNAASKDTKDVTLSNVEEEVDIRELHAVQTRRQTSSLAAKEEPKKEEAKEVKPVEAKQPVVESSKKKKKNDGFQVVTKPEVTGRPQKPKREDSESTPTDEGASTSKSSTRKNNKKGGKKGDKKEVEKKDPNKSIYKSLTPVTPTNVEETEKKDAEEKPDENAENKDAKKEKKQRADKEKQPRKPRRENVIVTNPYKDVDDFWSDEPVKPAVTASQPQVASKAQSEPVKKSAKKTKKSPVSSKQESGVVIVGSEVNPWANVGSVSETSSDESFPKLGEQPKRKKVAAKQAQLEDEDEEEEAKNPHKRESETHFEVQYEAPYEKKAKLNDDVVEEEEEGNDVQQVATEDAAEL